MACKLEKKSKRAKRDGKKIEPSDILNIRISPEIHSRIAALAQETGTTINGYIKQALERQLQSPQ